MKKSFGKKRRLLRRRDFLSMKNGSIRSVGRLLCLDSKPSQTKGSRLGISASTKYGSSCERNRFKRLIREAFRLTHGEWPSLDMHVVPRQKAKEAKLQDIIEDFSRLVPSKGSHSVSTP